MVIKGRSRAGAAELAAHLRRLDTNERMEVLEVRGTAAGALEASLREMEAVGSGTRCKRALYHASINTRADERMTVAQWQVAIDALEERLGLKDQPRVVVMHEKEGREHIHIVWSRIDSERMCAISDSHNYRKHEEVAREMERQFGHARVQGAHAERDGVARPERTPATADLQQAARSGRALDQVREDITAAWSQTDSGEGFRAELAERGYVLARGDRRDHVVVDAAGEVHSVARRIRGARAQDVRSRLADVRDMPSIKEAQQRQAERAAASRTADQVNVDAVLDHLLRTQSFVTETQLDRHLRDLGVSDVAAAASAVMADERVVSLFDHGERIGFTTREVRATEEAVLARSQRMAATPARRIADDILVAVAREKTLDAEQIAALQHAAAPLALSVIEGRAGSGKTHTLTAVREAAERSGYRVVGLAPTNSVTQDLRDSGFAEAITVHSVLWHVDHAADRPPAQADQRTLFVIDEAAMLDTRTLDKITAHAERHGAKMLLVGDDRQLGSIERGGVFTDVVGAVGSAKIATVRRQREVWARQASLAFSEGRFDEGLRAYAERGYVHWSADLDGSRDALVTQWRGDTEAGQGKRFVFAYTNEEVRRLNDALQAVEIERGRVKNLVELETERGTLRIGEGDRVAFRGTDKRRGIHNGALGKVEAIDGDILHVRSDRGRMIAVDTREFTEIDLGYAGTIFRGQGKTLDQTYLLHTKHWRDASSYVAMTRARGETQVYVADDQARDLDDLARQLGRQQNRGSSLRFATAQSAGLAQSAVYSTAAGKIDEVSGKKGLRRQGRGRDEQENE